MSIKQTETNELKPFKFKLGDLTLNAERRQVTDDKGNILDVIGLNFDMLLQLAIASPTPLSVQELQQKVWKDTIVSDDTVRQRVKLLRQALNVKEDHDAYVKANHSVGYSVIANPVESKKSSLFASKRWLIAAFILSAVIVMSTWLSSRDDAMRIMVSDFTALSPQDEYLSKGLSNVMMDLLFPIKGLTLVANKDKADSADITIEGSVLSAYEKLFISVRLVEQSSGDVLWSKKYEDKTINDVYDIQAHITAHVAMILRLEMEEDIYLSIKQGPTNSILAYHHYLIGRGQQTLGEFAQAKQSFEKALREDKAFELAKLALKEL